MRLSLELSDTEGGNGAVNRLFCVHVSLQLAGVEQDGVELLTIGSRAFLGGLGGVLNSAFLLCVLLHPLTGEAVLFKLFDIVLRVDNCNIKL